MSQKQRGKPSGQRSASSEGKGAAGKGAAGNSGFLDIAGLLGVEGKAQPYLLASVLLHIAVALALFVSWDFLKDDEVLVIPEYIDAHVISQQELEQLMSRKDKPQEKPAPEKKVEPPPEPEKQQEEERQQEIEELQREVEAKKKALLQKKEDERKEQEKKEKLAKEKKEKELKDKKEKEKKDKERKEKEKKEKEKKEKEKKDKEKEKKDLERLRQEREANLMKKLAEAEARENAAQAVQAEGKAATARELTEVERFMALIKKRVEDVWRKPPESEELVVDLEIRLLPNGELAGVEIERSSGVVPFDRSAVNAVQSVLKYPVPDDGKLFEKQFRKFTMSFRGQD